MPHLAAELNGAGVTLVAVALLTLASVRSISRRQGTRDQTRAAHGVPSVDRACEAWTGV